MIGIRSDGSRIEIITEDFGERLIDGKMVYTMFFSAGDISVESSISFPYSPERDYQKIYEAREARDREVLFDRFGVMDIGFE